MPENDPTELADQREHEADKLEQQSDQLQGEVQSVRQDWERKRADEGVPGAPPREQPDGEEHEDTSPGPEAPPEQEGPAAAEMPSEGAGGPPADSGEDDD